MDRLDKPVVFIECGINFGSGGLCVKTPHEMEYWYGDRVGTAGIVTTIQLMMHLHLFQTVNAADHHKKYVMRANQLVKI